MRQLREANHHPANSTTQEILLTNLPKRMELPQPN
jgi:hypothetical protein